MSTCFRSSTSTETDSADTLLAGQRPITLTVIQIVMVILGYIASAIVSQLYQRLVLLPAFEQELKNSILGQEQSRTWVILPWLFVPVMFIVARNCASFFYRIGRIKRQVKRDIKAARLLKKLNQGFPKPFSLYLRSFSQEELLKRKKGLGWYILVEGGIFGMENETLDLMISSKLRHSYPMIALGQPGEKLGAGRLPSTKAEWETLVLLLMKHAKAIFIVPSTSEGVIWEMEHLKNYSEKTVYIMPPAKFFHGNSEALEQQWTETQQEFIARGVFLPDYNRKGSLCMLNGHGHVARSSVFATRLGGSRILHLVSMIGEEQERRLSRIDHIAITWTESAMRIGRSVSPILIALLIAWMFVV